MLTTNKFSEAFFKKFDNSAAVILSNENRFYLTGFDSSEGAVVFTSQDKYLVVDFRYYEMAKKSCFDFNIVLTEDGILKTVNSICIKDGVSSVVFEDEFLTVSQNNSVIKLFNGFEIHYFEGFIKKLRAIKAPQEISKIRAAQQLTDETFSHVIGLLNKNMTENDVAFEIESFIRKNCGEPSFNTIAVSGTNSSLPHGKPSNTKLIENSFLTMDFGARLDGYCSDMTRTVVIGKATDDMKRIYNIVLEAQLKAIESVKAGALGADVDKAARDFININGYGNCFGHSTGHGLGIDVHEYPSFSPKFNIPVEENSVLSVEPGIYIEGKYGVRIEDIVVVKKEKCENLTQSSKKIIEIS